MVYLYYIIGALLESIKSPCVSRTFSLKDLLPTGFRGVFRRLLGLELPSFSDELLAAFKERTGTDKAPTDWNDYYVATGDLP